MNYAMTYNGPYKIDLKDRPLSPATVDDAFHVTRLLRARVEWLRERGSDQWLTWNEEAWYGEIERAAQELRLWVSWVREPRARIVGAVVTSTEGDQDFWTNDELLVPSLYLSKFVVDPEYRHQRIGAQMLRSALALADMQRRKYVRFDVWRTAYDLHRYYERQGWHQLRTVRAPGRWSGTLFQRDVRPWEGNSYQLHQSESDRLIANTDMC